MLPVIFRAGLNSVTQQDNNNEIDDNLPLYYWNTFSQQFANAGTLNNIRQESMDTDIIISFFNNRIKIGTVSNTHLYYNSTPTIPVLNTPPEGAEQLPIPVVLRGNSRQPAPASVQLAFQQGQLQAGPVALAPPPSAQTFHPNDVVMKSEVGKSTRAEDEAVDRLLCGICSENTKNIVLNCGHAICNVCNERLPKKECPFCKQPITMRQKLFIGGYKNDYKQKYLKYKQKYLSLKKL
jgi:hypothetical protein